MTNVRLLFTVAALAALLAACAVSGPPTPTGPGFDEEVTAQALVDFDELPAPRRTISLAPGAEAWIEVTFPTSAAADLMYVEIESTVTTVGLHLEWWNLSQTTRQLASYSPAIFGPPSALTPLGAELAAVDRSSIAIAWPCIGPCIARPYASGPKAIRVYNSTGSTRSVQIYAYGLRFTDELEPNDSQSSPRNVTVDAIGDTIVGAIEFSGDSDYIRINCAAGELAGVVRLKIDSVFEGDLVLRTTDGDVFPGGEETGFLNCPTTVRVFAADGTAGPSFTSRYTITVQ